MNRKKSLSIRHKLFFLFVMVLVLNLVATTLIGNTTFENFYSSHKEQELRSGADLIRSKFDSEEIYDALYDVESKNITVAIFHRDPMFGQIVVEYYSRFGSMDNTFRENMVGRLRYFYNEHLDEQIGEHRGPVLVADDSRAENPSLVLYGPVDGRRYMMLETSREYISETASLAMRYTTILSTLVLLGGALCVWVLAGRISSPIREMQQVADRLAAQQLDQRCKVRSTDEIGRLAGSINNMADQLEKTIGDLRQEQTKLKDDLYRQEQSDTLRRSFIANVSHDFKTPLCLITSYAEALRDLDDLPEETRKQYCDIIMGEGYKLSDMVEQLLCLSRIESGKLPLEESVFPVGELLRDTADHFRILMEEKQMTCRLLVDDEIIVRADHQKMGQVVTNLLDNAIKYGRPGGSVILKTIPLEGRCRVEVFNNGDPIPEEKQASLFLSFYRADEARSFAKGQSYGLGLAVVRAIMEQHHMDYGTLNVPDGVVFWFDMPLLEEQPEPEEKLLPETVSE